MRLKNHLLIACLITFSATAVFSQSVKNKEVQFLIDTTISIMKNNAVNSAKVNWVSLKQDAYKQAVDLDSPYELGGVMRNIYKSIDDFHGSFFYKDSTFRWNGNNIKISDSVRNEWKKRSGIKTAILGGSIGYLRVPSIPQGNGRVDYDKNAQNLNDSLCKVLSQNVKGIVLDLRINGGGAMFPMIMGLKQLLGEGKLGSFKNKKNQDWIIKQNTFFIDTTLLAAINPKCAVNADAMPVVVIIGTGTGSSGEFLAMTFKGRKNTLFLGTNTAGAVTVVGGYQINNTAFINLSVGYGRDRNGRDYIKTIEPDTFMDKPDNFNNLKKDEKVQAAIQWLKNKM